MRAAPDRPPTLQTQSVLRRFWESGYLYLAIAATLYLIYCLTGRIGDYDWKKDLAYVQYTRTSLVSYHTVPYFLWNTLPRLARYPAIARTSSFISNPETLLLSPFTPFLLLLSPVAFIKFMLAIHFAIGAAGLFALRRELQWSEVQFRTYAILFLFSPVIIQHIAIGFIPWLNLFFFPWLIFFLAHRNRLVSTLGLSLVLAWTLLQGGVHPFVWFALLTVLYAIARAALSRSWAPGVQLAFVFAATASLSFVRLYATAGVFSDFHQPFEAGYNAVGFVATALVPPLLIEPYDSFFMDRTWGHVPSYDAGVFWGAALPMLVILLVRYRRYREHGAIRVGAARNGLDCDALLISASVVFALSFGSLLSVLVNGITRIVPIVFADAIEKYPFRLAIPALLAYSVLIAHFSQDIWLDVSAWLERHDIERMPSWTIAKYGAAVSAVLCLLLLTASVFGSPRPFAGYLLWSHSTYRQMQIALLVAAVASALGSVMAQKRTWLRRAVEGLPFAGYEALLAAPLLFGSVMWFWVASAAWPTDYLAQDVLPPRLETPTGLPVRTAVTPQMLTVYPSPPVPGRYTLPDISFSDSRFLTPRNARLESVDGALSMVPRSDQAIGLEVDTSGFRNALFITTVSWLLVVGILVRGQRSGMLGGLPQDRQPESHR
jgi:hypothetical protein